MLDAYHRAPREGLVLAVRWSVPDVEDGAGVFAG
jgi:hypothetical protein